MEDRHRWDRYFTTVVPFVRHACFNNKRIVRKARAAILVAEGLERLEEVRDRRLDGVAANNRIRVTEAQ